MAADTRPYKSKEQDGQGNEVIIRDQQLVEQSTVTTMPSGACFETFDIDGRPVKIPRDNMMSIVLECIGIALNDSSKNLGTNVNKALGLQGNTIGNVTVNDFASVLGVELAASSFSIETNGLTGSRTVDYGMYLLRLISPSNSIVALIILTDFNEVTGLITQAFSSRLDISYTNGTVTITSKNSNEYTVYFQRVFNK